MPSLLADFGPETAPQPSASPKGSLLGDFGQSSSSDGGYGANQCWNYARDVLRHQGWKGNNTADLSNPKYGVNVTGQTPQPGDVVHLAPGGPGTTKHWAIVGDDGNLIELQTNQTTRKASIHTDRLISSVQKRISGVYRPHMPHVTPIGNLIGQSAANAPQVTPIAKLIGQPNANPLASYAVQPLKIGQASDLPINENPAFQPITVQTSPDMRVSYTAIDAAGNPVPGAIGTVPGETGTMHVPRNPNPAQIAIAEALQAGDKKTAAALSAASGIPMSDPLVQQRVQDIEMTAEPPGRDVVLMGLMAGVPIPGVSALEKAGYAGVERSVAGTVPRMLGKAAVRGAIGTGEAAGFNAISTAPDIVNKGVGPWVSENVAALSQDIALGGVGRAVVAPILAKAGEVQGNVVDFAQRVLGKRDYAAAMRMADAGNIDGAVAHFTKAVNRISDEKLFGNAVDHSTTWDSDPRTQVEWNGARYAVVGGEGKDTLIGSDIDGNHVKIPRNQARVTRPAVKADYIRTQLINEFTQRATGTQPAEPQPTPQPLASPEAAAQAYTEPVVPETPPTPPPAVPIQEPETPTAVKPMGSPVEAPIPTPAPSNDAITVGSIVRIPAGPSGSPPHDNLVVIDASDPAMLRVQNEHGTQFNVGRGAAQLVAAENSTVAQTSPDTTEPVDPFVAKLQEDLTTARNQPLAEVVPGVTPWEDAKVGDIVGNSNTGFRKVVARKVKTKREATALAEQTGGRVGLDGKGWSVTIPAEQPAAILEHPGTQPSSTPEEETSPSSPLKIYDDNPETGKQEPVSLLKDYPEEAAAYGKAGEPAAVEPALAAKAGEKTAAPQDTNSPAKTAEAQGLLYDYHGAQIVRNDGADRIQIFFDEKPDATIRGKLKAAGWRWSPANNAWQRMNTHASVMSASDILDKHFEKKEVAATAEETKPIVSKSGDYEVRPDGDKWFIANVNKPEVWDKAKRFDTREVAVEHMADIEKSRESGWRPVKPKPAAPSDAAKPEADVEKPNLRVNEEAVMRTLSDVPLSVDDIISQSGLSPTEASGNLTRLEIQGLVTRKPGNAYVLSDAGTAIMSDYKPKKPTPKLLAVDENGKVDTVALSKYFKPLVKLGEPVDITHVKQVVSVHTGIPVSELGRTKSATGLDWKGVEEAYEYAVVKRLHEIAESDATDEEKWELVKQTYDNQPNLASRDSASKAAQQYSTPAPIAWAMDKYLGLDNTEKAWRVYEPTAGNGMLVAMANPDRVFVNELDTDYRKANLEDYGYNRVTNENAIGLPERHVGVPNNYTYVIMNPPFGSATPKSYSGGVGNYKMGKIEHQIVIDSLDAMSAKGKAAFIIGGHNFEGHLGQSQPMTAADKIFFNYLMSRYNVTHNIDVAGDLYSKMGTKFPIRVITVSGRKPSFDIKTAPTDASQVEKAATFDDLWGILSKEGGEHVEHADEIGSGGIISSDEVAPELEGHRVRPVGAKRTGSSSKPKRPSAGNRNRPQGAGARTGGDGTGNTRVGGKPGKLEQSGEVVRADEPTGKAGSLANRPHGLADASQLGHHGVAVNDFQSEYVPESKGTPLGNKLIPTNLAEPTANAIARIAADHGGDVDEWVRDELGYPNKAALYKSLAAEQIDAVAMAIDAIMHGKGMIVGDQAGVGKGRVAVSIKDWAQLNGYTPVMLTAKANLFSDWYRDSVDTGRPFNNPLILNSDPSTANITDDDGNVVIRAGGNLTKKLADFRANPGNYDAVLLTYSQLQGKADDTKQKQFLMELAPKSILIMDESHEAAGESNRGLFLRSGLMPKAPGVVYLSATYAKRPESFPAYWKTELGASIHGQYAEKGGPPQAAFGNDPNKDDDEKAVDPLGGLVTAIKKGGVPLQEWAAMELANVGHYLRRDPDFSDTRGVSIHIDDTPEHAARDIKRADEIRSVLRAITSFDVEKNQVVDIMNKAAKGAAKREAGVSYSAKFSTAAGVSSTMFASKIHNFISQLLLATKADLAVEQAIAAHKDGRKPLIALSNTMETFLNDLAEQTGVSIGEEIPINFNWILRKAFAGTLKINTTAHDGTKSVQDIPFDNLPANVQEQYHQIEKQIDSISSELPGSPIDYILYKLQQAGINVGELTARTNRVVYHENADGKLGATYTARTAAENDRKGLVRKFNSGDIDALIINTTGATGISAHASEKFKDKRGRVMFIAQPELNIDTELQKMFRIFRSGQVREFNGQDVRPAYVYLLSSLAAEIRPAVVNQRKLKAMNANTSANAGSSFSLDSIPDMMNSVGDEVMAKYLAKPEMRDTLLSLLPKEMGERSVDQDTDENMALVKLMGIESLAAKTTGRMALLPEVQVRAHLQKLEDAFNDRIAYLNEIDENPLVSKNYDWQATTKESNQVMPAKDSSSAFTAGVRAEKLSVRAEHRPYNTAKLREVIETALDGKTPADHLQGTIDKLNQLHSRNDSELQKELKQSEADYAKLPTEENGLAIRRAKRDIVVNNETLMNLTREVKQLEIGKTLEGEDPYRGPGHTIKAVVTGVRVENAKKGENPLVPSKVKVTLAVADSRQKIIVPLSQRHLLAGLKQSKSWEDSWDSAIASVQDRDTRYVLTGALTDAAQLSSVEGGVARYTTEDGSTKWGFVLSNRLEPSVITSLMGASIATPAALEAHLKANPGYTGVTADNQPVFLRFRDGTFQLEVPSSKAKGAKFYADPVINELASRGKMYEYGKTMQADIKTADIGQLLDHLINKLNVRFVIKNNAAEPTGPAPRYNLDTGDFEVEPAKLDPKEVLEATRRLGSIARSNTRLRKGVKGQYVPGKIEVGDVRDTDSMVHEMGHAIDAVLYGGEGNGTLADRVGGNNADMVKELQPISRLIRPPGKAKLPKGYRSSAPELFADYISLFVTDPVKAQDMAPEFTRRFIDKLIDNHPEVRQVLEELHEGNVRPAVAETSKPIEEGVEPPGRVGRVAKVKVSHDLGVKARGEALVKRTVRDRKAHQFHAFQNATRWQGELTEKQLEDVGALSEGIGNLRIKGDTVQSVKARMTPKMEGVLKDFRYEQELARQAINDYMKDATDEEYIAFLADYLPHYYANSLIKLRAFTGKWMMNSPNAEDRVLPTLQEAVDYGLTPITQNVATLHRMWANVNWKVATNRAFVAEAKDMKLTDGSPAVVPTGTKTPPPWVDSKTEIFHHPAIDKVYAVKGPDGTLKLWRGGVWVHPDLAPAYKMLLQVPMSNKVLGAWDAINAFSKQMLFTLSFFHHTVLAESALGVLGKAYNPARGVVVAGEKHPVTGKRIVAARPYKLGKDLFPTEIATDAIEHGLTLTPPTEATERGLTGILTQIEAHTRTNLISAVMHAIQAPIKANQDFLWNVVHPGYKLCSYYYLTRQEIMAHPERDPNEIKESVANVLNNFFGGQEWETKFKVTPEGLRWLRRLMIAPDWALSVANSAAGAFSKDPVRRNLSIKYWLKMLPCLATIIIGASAAVYEMFGDDSKGDHIGPWDNEEGHKDQVDITGLTRLLPWYDPDDSRRYYLDILKIPHEIMGWITDPVREAGNKASPVLRMGIEQLSGTEMGRYSMPWKKAKTPFWESIPSRVGSVVGSVAPLSLSTGSFVAPIRRGVKASTARTGRERRGTRPGRARRASAETTPQEQTVALALTGARHVDKIASRLRTPSGTDWESLSDEQKSGRFLTRYAKEHDDEESQNQFYDRIKSQRGVA